MLIIEVIIVFIIIWTAFTYNRLISLRNRARNAWADIDVQLKRRHDLIPNLVAVVQGYAAHEKSTLEDIARLRAKAESMSRVDEIGGAETELTSALRTLFAVAESYPSLRADANFRELQTQITDIENNIQYARRYYNAVVRDFNTLREIFPSNVIAALFGFEKLPYFQIEDDERNPIKTEFNGVAK